VKKGWQAAAHESVKNVGGVRREEMQATLERVSANFNTVSLHRHKLTGFYHRENA